MEKNARRRSTEATGAPQTAVERFKLTQEGTGTPYTARAFLPSNQLCCENEKKGRYGLALDDLNAMRNKNVRFVDTEVAGRKLTLDLKAVAEGTAGFGICQRAKEGKKNVEYYFNYWRETIDEGFEIE